MSERMGGVVRIINKDSPNPDLLRDRLEEQREREKGSEEKETSTTRMSKLQKLILDLCVKNPSSYSATLNQILDKYFGKNKPTTKAMLNTVRKSIRSLKKRGYVELMSGRVKRVQLTPTVQRYIKERSKKSKK